MALPDPARQKASRQVLRDVLAAPAGAFAIHYACRSFHDGEQVSTPRVAAIAVQSLETGQAESFSIQQEAETIGLASQAVPQHLDELEKGLLQRFYAFVRTNRRARYVHWNMRDARYGFAALEQRMRVLGSTPVAIPEDFRIDLSRHLTAIYGASLVRERAKLIALARLNELSLAGIIDGAAEAEAFDQGRYRDVTGSTLQKARVIAELTERASNGTLATEAGFLARHAGPLRLMWAGIRDNPIPSVLATLAGSFMVFVKLYDWLFPG